MLAHIVHNYNDIIQCSLSVNEYMNKVANFQPTTIRKQNKSYGKTITYSWVWSNMAPRT